jgi:hypothetical protein
MDMENIWGKGQENYIKESMKSKRYVVTERKVMEANTRVIQMKIVKIFLNLIY